VREIFRNFDLRKKEGDLQWSSFDSKLFFAREAIRLTIPEERSAAIGEMRMRVETVLGSERSLGEIGENSNILDLKYDVTDGVAIATIMMAAEYNISQLVSGTAKEIEKELGIDGCLKGMGQMMVGCAINDRRLRKELGGLIRGGGNIQERLERVCESVYGLHEEEGVDNEEAVMIMTYLATLIEKLAEGEN